MKKLLILLSILLCISGCDSSQTAPPTETPTPTPEVTAAPPPTPEASSTAAVTILQAAEQFMTDYGYACSNVTQLGETYMTPEYMMAVIRGTYTDGSGTVEMLHLAHLDFKDGGYQVLNLYPGEEDTAMGVHFNVININGETIIWTTVSDALQSNQLRVYYGSGAYEDVPIANEASIFRFKSGVDVVKLAPLDANGGELSALTAEGDALTPLANITHSIGAEIHPMTGEVLGLCGYPKAPDSQSNDALTDAMETAGLLNSRSDFTLIAAKEYSDRIYSCITYTRNGQTVYELIISTLTVEGNIDIQGICEFAPPTEQGYAMYSTAIENDIICWTLLNETRLEGSNPVLMDFNAFRFYWENGDSKDDLVVDRFFIYTNRHVALPTQCAPIVNGAEVSALTQTITRVNFSPLP